MKAALDWQYVLELVRRSVGSDNGPKTQQEALAVLVHAMMLSTGFRLIGLDDQKKLDMALDAESEDGDLTLSPEWKASPSYFTFRYAHTQSSLTFVIKVSRLGSKTVVLGLAEGDDKTASFDFVTNDYTSPSFFTHAYDMNDLAQGYIGASRIRDLASLLKINILQRLLPGLSKTGYTEENTSATTTTTTTTPRETSSTQPYPRQPYSPSFGGIPARHPINPGPYVPDFDDEHQYLPPRPGGNMGGGLGPFSIGHDDLNPPGLNPTFPFGTGGHIPLPGGGGGMHPTADHPIFGDRARRPGGRGGMVPEGARYDPLYPGDTGSGGSGGLRGPGPGSRRGPPDADFSDMMPPGAGNMVRVPFAV